MVTMWSMDSCLGSSSRSEFRRMPLVEKPFPTNATMGVVLFARVFSTWTTSGNILFNGPILYRPRSGTRGQACYLGTGRELARGWWIRRQGTAYDQLWCRYKLTWSCNDMQVRIIEADGWRCMCTLDPARRKPGQGTVRKSIYKLTHTNQQLTRPI
jgi:hypothetical protein